jgi:hypothetical protein
MSEFGPPPNPWSAMIKGAGFPFETFEEAKTANGMCSFVSVK